ncbi:cytochrome P450 [Diaporthe amygdali]|uniref:cytochrome P450 n=1 Tax=Phomopsis amygdali TaxID=1214568 RepID=UPI0022FDF143|nr:cytochrome P450 [Diaporthe amygdali]KAJ0114038.1 cytochrome P450 [Diaporthe amygdali]
MSILLGALRACVLLTLGATIHYGFCMYRNDQAARKIGVPIRIIPIWLVVDRCVLFVLKRLPEWFGNNGFTRYNYRGWEVPDRYFSHQKSGDAYILVSSENAWLYMSDPDAVTDIAQQG